jgi:hypothetical protein
LREKNVDLKADIRQAIEKFANDSGYSGSIVEPYAVEIVNLIDILGDTKYTELAALVYRISAGLQHSGESISAGSREKGETGASTLSPELKAEIIGLIRAELGRGGDNIQEKTGKTAEAAVEPTAPFDLETAKKHFEAVAGKVLSCVAEDISTLIDEKIKPEFQGIEETSGAEIIKAAEGKYITVENFRDNGPKLIFRMQAKSLIRVAGVMSMMPQNVLEEKMTTFNLNQSDLDAIKEVCNQMTGSINRAIPSEKSKLGAIINFDEAKEKELLGDVRFIICRYKMGSTPELMGNVEVMAATADSMKL